jgi:hypothetical protein
LQHENDDLNQQLVDEEERGDQLHQDLAVVNSQVDEMEVQLESFTNNLRIKTREHDNLKARASLPHLLFASSYLSLLHLANLTLTKRQQTELNAMSNVSSDATKLLTEKLALAREVALLSPEVESLRAQVAANKDLLAEKLAMQRQLSTLQVELENAQRTIQRNAAKEAKNHDRTEFELQMDDMQNKLKEEGKARREAEREVERLKGDLEDVGQVTTKKSKKDTKKDEKLAELQDTIDELNEKLQTDQSTRIAAEREISDLKEQLAKAKQTKNKKAKSDDDTADLKSEIDSLRKDLATEKKERANVQKALEKEKTAWEAQKSLLDDKLSQFRTKLRSSKDEVKVLRQQVQEAQAAAVTKPAASARNPRKRGASQIEDSAIGTPGDGPQIKRNKRGSSTTLHTMPGDKSTFSITPFLNRAISLPPSTPDGNEPTKPLESMPDLSSPIVEAVGPEDESPSAEVSKKVGSRSKPLSQASSSKHNARSRKSARAPTLEKVLEEPSSLSIAPNSATKTVQFETRDSISTQPTATLAPSVGDPPTATLTLNPPTATTAVPTLKTTTLKPRKSLMSFASFTTASEPEKRKKRKLGGGKSGPKTIFDEDDEEPAPSKPIPGRGLFGGGAAAAGKASFLFGAKKQQAAQQAGAAGDVSAFAFSPLKKDRRR